MKNDHQKKDEVHEDGADHLLILPSEVHLATAQKVKGVTTKKEFKLVVTDKRVMFLERHWSYGRCTKGKEESFSLDDLRHVSLDQGAIHCSCKGVKQHGTLTLDFCAEANIMSWQGVGASSGSVIKTGCKRTIKINLDGAQKAYNQLQAAMLSRREAKAHTN